MAPTPLTPTMAARAATSPALRYLVDNLTHSAAPPGPTDPPLTLIAAPDQAAEVRAALRWLKERIVLDGLPAGTTALIARDVTPYLSAIRLTARELGLPLHFAVPLPLRRSPIIAALLDLLRIYITAESGAATLPRRPLIATWRSPYFNWFTGSNPIGVTPADADRLDLVARYLQVVSGLTHWREALQRLSAGGQEDAADSETPLPSQVPSGADAAAPLALLDRFLTATSPPQGRQSPAAFIRWLERLIGPDEDGQTLPEGAWPWLSRCAWVIRRCRRKTSRAAPVEGCAQWPDLERLDQRQHADLVLQCLLRGAVGRH